MIEAEQRALIEPAPLSVDEGLSAARALASSVEADQRFEFARSVVHGCLHTYWNEVGSTLHCHWPLRTLPDGVEIAPIPDEASTLAQRIGAAVAHLDPLEAGYLVGVLYTTMMPRKARAKLGAYYTPPALCERLLDMATDAGVDWASARVLDPACGGGAFLAPVARRMVASRKGRDARAVLRDVQRRLVGFEVDPFAAWMSQVVLDVALNDLCRDAGAQLGSVVRVCDSLEQVPAGEGFDLVVGNPPYGRITLSPPLRRKFKRSLFGHANLYGVFTDLALRFTRAGGVIAYVTPTSFLAGEYFKALRGLLGREAPPASIGFVSKRKGVFADVLQETLLATYQRGGDSSAGTAHFISSGDNGSIEVGAAGSFSLPESPDQPWLMPRTEAHGALLSRVGASPYRLADYGYKVSTGPLVWNRHKTSLQEQPGDGRYPLVWAESVRSDGRFEFRAAKRNHKPYFQPTPNERWVVTDFPCVLLQRTTAREQCRRLIAAELPSSFLEEHGAVVVENHLNMVKPLNGTPKVSSAALAALLNSDVVDQVFRCINGSVAVSAYELEALPLPPPKAMEKIEPLVARGAGRETLEGSLCHAYR
ncbi:MAG: N-6 DNA methylase [Gammaproteobacteria bacterium]|nr:N-6 DNA methylase [Gammaproteobacteria bacterium]